MADEIAPQPQTPAPAVRKEPIALQKPGFMFVPKTWDELYAFAKQICATDFVPKAMRDSPGAVLAAWQKGQEVGLPPMAALESIGIINGRPSIHSNGFWSLVISNPLCEWFDEDAPDIALKQGFGRCVIKRRGAPKPTERRFSMEEAKVAGLLTKDNWKNYPGDMLQNRARHRAADDAVPEACQGLLPSDVARDLPPEPRDVTPIPEQPLKLKPQPIQEADHAGSTVETGTTAEGTDRDSSDRSQLDEAGESAGREAAIGSSAGPTQENTDQAKGTTLPSVDDPANWTLDERKAWASEATLDELSRSDNQAIKDMKILGQKDRAEICRYVTDRRQVLATEAKKAEQIK